MDSGLTWYDTFVPKFFKTIFARSTSFAFTAARLTVGDVAQFNGARVTASCKKRPEGGEREA